VLHSWVLLDSHDVARFRVVAGSHERHVVGIGLQMTTPGVPMVFAGDELGLEGSWGEDARRPMPWERPGDWDTRLFEEYRTLVGLRRASSALARGGFRFAHVSADAIAYLRETRDERLLCLATRTPAPDVRLPLTHLDCTSLEPLYGAEARTEGGAAVLPGDGPAFHVWRLRDG
jgi:alpha-glucosidase